jgi:hypothetical protein
MQVAGERAGNHGLQQSIPQVVTNNHDRPGFTHFAALHWFQAGDVDIVTVHLPGSPGKAANPSGRDSQSDQFSSVWAISW